ncbi:PREDICTED: LOW QUALITY PROTEIN: caspase-1-like [Atta cephalotes]|uniref:Caspase family p20 domain-containing protein n=1 Tax=Atta cephalotes TaxID=12957 RepID=A0A158P1I1_ATTCE|nr:PREDICTED: LOW QUALITY PROTEIN: caspase-1-like [Atta cephalotes]
MATTRGNMQADDKYTPQQEQWNISTPDRSQRSVPDGWSFRKANDISSRDMVNAMKNVKIDLNPDDEEYNMKHKRRGVAIILNHVHFENMGTREGSEKDTLDLKTSLSKLGFDVQIYTDPTFKTISTVLQSTAAEDHTDADCLIVVAMSHGESGLLHSADSIYPVDALWNPFTGDQCLSLAGKPKLFFIQACRGMQLDNGVTVFHKTDSIKSDTLKYSIPAYADILVAYSTYDGFFSWRNPNNGSWFIQALCEELDLHGRSRDLLTIMTFVNRRVAIEYQSYVPQNEKFHAKKQIPSIVSMLTRFVYFHDKHTEPNKRTILTMNQRKRKLRFIKEMQKKCSRGKGIFEKPSNKITLFQSNCFDASKK